jgi:hypothetical protein
MSHANRRFCGIVFAVAVLFGFCIPSIADSVTYKSSVPTGSLASLWGPRGHVSPHPRPGPVGVADGDPSSLVLLAIGLSVLLVTAVVARAKPRTRT